MIKNKAVMRFNSLDAAKFFLRAFDLENNVQEALAMFGQAPKHHDRIACPIISEYDVDQDLKFVFFLLITVDPVGLRDGTGVIYCADSTNLEEVTTLRDKLADEMMREVYPGKKEGRFVVIESGKERGRL
jgi:hypothetical protein